MPTSKATLHEKERTRTKGTCQSDIETRGSDQQIRNSRLRIQFAVKTNYAREDGGFPYPQSFMRLP